MTGNVAAASSSTSTPRFDRKYYFPHGWEACLEEFLKLFHRYGYIYKPLAGGSWLSANEKWQLSDTEILKAIACVHSRFYLGCRSGRATKFAVLDIDANSQYHNSKGLKQIQQALGKAGIKKTVLYRSSHSGGWHLYLFFEELISCRDLRKQLVTLFQLSDISIEKGTLEIFPSPGEGSVGHGLRLPLQPGWAWLDNESLEIIHDRSQMLPTEALELFIDDFSAEANSHHDFHQLKRNVEDLVANKERITARTNNAPLSGQLVPLRRNLSGQVPSLVDQVATVFGALPPGIDVAVWLKGRDYYLEGLTGPSQRADAIFSLSHYLFYGDPQREIPALGYGCEQERRWAIEEILLSRHNGQSKEISYNRGDALQQVERAASWVPAHKRNEEHKPYQNKVPISWVRNNSKRARDARERIRQTIEELSTLSQKFSLRQLRLAAKCSMDTLYKNRDLWEAIQTENPDHFVSDPDEYNAVFGAASSESKPQDTAPETVTPPGLLAARRIAYELQRRQQRSRMFIEKEKRVASEEISTVWRQSVAANIPEIFDLLHQSDLKRLLVFLAWRRGTSPDYESELWINGKISLVRAALESKLTFPPWIA